MKNCIHWYKKQPIHLFTYQFIQYFFLSNNSTPLRNPVIFVIQMANIGLFAQLFQAELS